VHLILGDSAAATFRRVFHPGDRLLIDRDVLSCGPTPRCEYVETWCKMRSEFWNSQADPPPMPESAFGLLTEQGVNATRIDLIQFETTHDNSEPIVSTGQLNLPRMDEHPQPR